MYVPPFWCGFAAGMLVTTILFVIFLIQMAKKGGGGNEPRNSNDRGLY